jgi:hypothetical protein
MEIRLFFKAKVYFDWHPLSPHPNPLSDGERIKVRGKASR